MEKIASREIGFMRVDCLLHCHNLDLNFDEMLRTHQYDEIRKYIIQLPIYMVKSKSHDYTVKNYRSEELSRRDLYLLDILYNETYGLVPPDPDHGNMP